MEHSKLGSANVDGLVRSTSIIYFLYDNICESDKTVGCASEGKHFQPDIFLR